MKTEEGKRTQGKLSVYEHNGRYELWLNGFCVCSMELDKRDKEIAEHLARCWNSFDVMFQALESAYKILRAAEEETEESIYLLPIIGEALKTAQEPKL